MDLFEIQIGTETIPRLPCPACCGCGHCVGAGIGGSTVGRCRSCYGSRIENFWDYRLRVLSWFPGANREPIDKLFDAFEPAMVA